MIDVILSRGYTPLIAIRDTKINHRNPFTTDERIAMIRGIYGDKVEIIVIPDIDNVIYGRDVGYGIERVVLSNELEQISASELRKNDKGRIIWLTGNSGSGKTTLARELSLKMNAVVLDGDALRGTSQFATGFTKAERDLHNLRVAELAKKIAGHGIHVVVSVIAPYRSTREKITKLIDPFWVYLDRGLPERKEYPYEAPSVFTLRGLTVEEEVNIVMEAING